MWNARLQNDGSANSKNEESKGKYHTEVGPKIRNIIARKSIKKKKKWIGQEVPEDGRQ